jgi:hypothetical protein
VLEDAGHAAGGRRHRPGVEVLALGVTRVLEVAVQVDRSGQDHQPGRLDDLVGPGQHPVVVSEPVDAFPRHHHVGTERPVGRGYGAVGDNPGKLPAHRRSPPSPHNVKKCCMSLIDEQRHL